MTSTDKWPANSTARRSVASLVPYARNARTHAAEQVAQIAASITEWGWTTPVLIDGDDGIIAGHGRILAAQLLNIADVPVIVASGWTEAQKRAYIIADNQLTINGAWDEDLLRVELDDLRSSDFDIDLLGFDSSELDALIAGEPGEYQEEYEEPGEDKLNGLREKWGVRRGQLWRLGDHLIVCGDCAEKETVDRVLSEGVPHLMVTDPPYGVNYDADWRNHALRSLDRAVGKVENDDVASWGKAWDLFPGDVAYTWCGNLTAHIAAQSLVDSGFEVRALICWVKSNFAIGRGHYHNKHEPCWYAVRQGATGHWAGDRKQTTVWDIDKPTKSETGHSTQKPIDCMAIPIRNNSERGDLVYEPFSGSGTTIIACEMLGRVCRAIEINPAYVAVALQRFEDTTGKTPILVSDPNGSSR